MTETKHTPGPWVWDEIAPDDPEWGACEIWPASNGDPDYEPVATMVCGVADARLIAAAPDLLEAARDALAGWRYIREHHGDLYGVGWDRVEAALRAAIAKATGDDA